jgi:phosphoribosyl-ATP pyrophosphohydrolase/phosphoribosyl-AMP cyclohydrolase/histidinol dehydrogenase
MEKVRTGGDAALVEVAIKLGDIQEGQKHVIGRDEMKAAYDSLPADEQAVLSRTADRIRKFAMAQRASVQGTTTVQESDGS